jgi:predicted HTH transcriptional regulator
MADFSDQELLLKLRNFEDNFVERKTISDNKDWLKTVVAFANSVPIGYPAILFISVKNDGTIRDSVNLDKLQMTLAAEPRSPLSSSSSRSQTATRASKPCGTSGTAGAAS